MPRLFHVADLWHGHVVRLRIGAHSNEQWSYWSLGVAWLMCWIGVMLVAGWCPLLIPAPAALAGGAWWAGIVFMGVIETWHAAVWAIPAILAGAVLTVRVLVTVADRRHRARGFHPRSSRYG